MSATDDNGDTGVLTRLRGRLRRRAERAAADSLRSCPACQADAHVYAERCRHCGEDLEVQTG